MTVSVTSPTSQPLCKPPIPRGKKCPFYCVVSAASTTERRKSGGGREGSRPSGLETRISLLTAVATQSSSRSQRLLIDLATETAKYLFPKRFESRNLEEFLMAVPDIETVKFNVLRRTDEYEIREVEPYFVAEMTMPGRNGFDFGGASQAFNVLAAYLFGKNSGNESMEMTTPVYTRKTRSDGEKLDMTTPVIMKQSGGLDKWQMSFVMPSKYGAKLPLPKDPSVKIKEVPRKVIAVGAFSGLSPCWLVQSSHCRILGFIPRERTITSCLGLYPKYCLSLPPPVSLGSAATSIAGFCLCCKSSPSLLSQVLLQMKK